MSDNLLYQNKFEITMPNTPTLAGQIVDVQFLGPQLNETRLPYADLDIDVPGEKIVYGKLDLIFLVDENLEAYKEIYDSMMKSSAPDAIQSESKRKDIFQDITISFLTNSLSGATRTITFKDSWFSLLGNMSLNTQATESVPVECTVTITYHYIEFN